MRVQMESTTCELNDHPFNFDEVFDPNCKQVSDPRAACNRNRCATYIIDTLPFF